MENPSSHIRVHNNSHTQVLIPGPVGIKVDAQATSARIHVNCVDLTLLKHSKNLTFFFSDEDGLPVTARVQSRIEEAAQPESPVVTAEIALPEPAQLQEQPAAVEPQIEVSNSDAELTGQPGPVPEKQKQKPGPKKPAAVASSKRRTQKV